MRQDLQLAERLIVAADFTPDKDGEAGLWAKLLSLASSIAGSGVIIKVNSALRVLGFGLIDKLHAQGVRVMADLKLDDIPNTLATDGKWLKLFKPDLLTVKCSAGLVGMKAIQEELGDITEVLGVTVLTSLDDVGCSEVYTTSPAKTVERLAELANAAGISGLVLSGKEVELVKSLGLPLSLVTPGIRPFWSLVANDDQSRVVTPEMAIKNGVDRIVVGRPITGAIPNEDHRPQNPQEATDRILLEIENALT